MRDPWSRTDPGEGYRHANMPTIEIVRANHGLGRITGLNSLFALVTDTPLPDPLPQFGLDDAASVADLIEERIFRRR